MTPYSEKDYRDAAELRDAVHRQALARLRRMHPDISSVEDPYPPEAWLRQYWDYPGAWYPMVAIPEGFRSRDELIGALVSRTLTAHHRIGNRVAILGPTGAGKSTLARRLHALTGLPLYHLDLIWWKPDQTHITRAEFDQALAALTERKRWIIEGDYSRTYGPRIRACDTVIFLDYDEETCLKGLQQRVGQQRPDIHWVEEKLEPELVAYARSFRTERRPKLTALLEQHPEKQILTFQTREQADAWLEAFAAAR